VTLYNALGEDDDGVMQWARTVLHGVVFERKSGAVASVRGGTSTGGLMLYIPATLGGYVEPHEYAGAGWTLRDGDMVAIGEQSAASPHDVTARRDVYKITGSEPMLDLRGVLDHFEVSGV